MIWTHFQPYWVFVCVVMLLVVVVMAWVLEQTWYVIWDSLMSMWRQCNALDVRSRFRRFLLTRTRKNDSLHCHNGPKKYESLLSKITIFLRTRFNFSENQKQIANKNKHFLNVRQYVFIATGLNVINVSSTKALRNCVPLVKLYTIILLLYWLGSVSVLLRSIESHRIC